MAPQIQPLHPYNLESSISSLPNGKTRKPENRQALLDCQLKELVQFDCQVGRDRVVVCRPIARIFRRCKDGLTVETTAWETDV